MRMKQSQRGGQTIIGNAIHSDLAVVVGDVLHEPFDGVVSVGGLVGGFGIVQIDLRGRSKYPSDLKRPRRFWMTKMYPSSASSFHEEGICSGAFSGTP